MGVVYEAEQVSLGRRVALKVLPAHLLADPKHRKRFEREAKAAARLHHTNIVPVYGVGESDGLYYYVMQFIHGLGLDEVLIELRKQRRAKKSPQEPDRIEPALTRSQRAVDISAVDVARSLMTGHHVPVHPQSEMPGGSDLNATEPRLSPVLSPPPAASAPTSGATSGTGHSTLTESGRRYWQSVARIGIQVAEALDYAASQGILHRDIKPSNLLLDTQNNVWVTDFGLAKATADEENLTHTGDIVGTLRYMAPERFEGHSDVRGDIYSLGLTLYELLVQRPAFDENDRNKLIHQVTHEEPPHPRKLNSAIPRDLETIVLKAIEREPNRRYQTASALSQDLKRFLEDKPILARRVSTSERFWRWCRRNPAVASLAGGIAALLVIVAVASSLAAIHFGDLARQEHKARQDAEDAAIRAEAAQKREAEERRKAEESRQIAEDAQKREAEERKQSEQARVAAETARKNEAEQRKKAESAQKESETSLRQARKAVDDYLTTVSESRLLREPGLQPLRKELLESALAYYKGFLKQRSDDPSIQRDLASAYLRVGKVTAEIGSPADAQRAYDQALAILTKIEPKTPDLQLDLAAVHQAAGNLRRQLGSPDDLKEALKSLDEAYRLLLLVSPQNPNARGRLNLVGGTYVTGVKIHSSTDVDMLGRFFSLLNDQADLLTQNGAADKAMTKRFEALLIQQGLVRNQSNHARIVSFRQGLAAQWSRLGIFQAEMGLTARALGSFEESQNILSKLEKDYPRHDNLAEFRHDQAANQEHLGDVRATMGDLKAAISWYQKALPIRERLALENGAVTEYQVDLARTRFRLGALQYQAGQLEPAQESLRQAIDRQRQLVERLPQIKEYTRTLVRQLTKLSDVQRRANQLADAAATVQQAGELLDKLPPAGLDFYDLALLQAAASDLVGQGKAELSAAEQAQRTKEAAGAVQSLAKAVAAGFKDFERLEKDPGFAPLRAQPDFQALVADLRKKSKILSWTEDFEAAKAQAAREKKDLFLWFTGTDWAEHAVVFKKTYLSREEFFDYAQQHFVMVEMDYPMHRPKTKHFPTVHELQSRWQIQGYPTLILADGAGRAYGTLQGVPQLENFKDYIKRLEDLRRVRIRRDEAIAKAEAAKGPEKARWLDSALNILPPRFRADHDNLIRAVRKEDAEDQSGLRSKYLTSEVDLHRHEAQAAGRRKDWAGAARLVTQALEELKPTDNLAWPLISLRANAQAEQGQFERAADDYARTIELSPQSSAIWHFLALARLAAGQEADYRALCRTLLERLSASDLNVVQTWCLAPHIGTDWAALVRSVDDSRSQDSTSYYTLRLLGRVYYRAGRYDAALTQLERAIQLARLQDRDFIAIEMAFLAMAHHRLGHAAEAKRWLKRMQTTIAERDRRWVKDKDSALVNDSWVNRITETIFRCEAEALLDAVPADLNETQRLAYARAHARLGQWDKALTEYEKLLEKQSVNGQLLMERGRAHQQLGHKEKAEADHARAEKLLATAVAEARSGWEMNRTDAERRSTLNEAYWRLARLQIQAGRPAEACQTLFTASQLWSEDAARLYGIASEVAALIPRMGKDPAHPTADAQAERARIGGRVLGLVRQVVAAGYEHTTRFQRDKEWEPIRQLDDYRSLRVEIDFRGRFPAPTEEAAQLVGHRSGRSILAVSVSPDGRRALSAGMDGTIRLWDLGGRKELRRIDGYAGSVFSVSFSPDGRRALIAGNESAVRLWDVETGQEIRRLVGHTGWVATARFLPDGRRALTGGSEGVLRLWDLESGKELRSFKSDGGSIRDLAVSPDGRRALSGGDDKLVHLWDLESGKELGKFKGHEESNGTVWSVAFSPDGKRGLSGGADGLVILWDLDGGKELRRAPSEDRVVRDAIFAPDGRSVLIAGEQKLSLWNLETDQELQPSSQTLSHTRAALLPGGKFALTADNDGIVRLWSLSEGADRLALYNRARQFDKVLAEYDRLLKKQPNDVQLRLSRARLYARKGLWEKARADLSEVLRQAPDQTDPWVERGRCLAMLGQWEAAAADYTKGMALYKDDAAGLAQRRILAAELAHWDAAFARATELRPDDAILWIAGAQSFSERGQRAKADAAYTRAGELLRGELNQFLQAGWWVVGTYPEDIKTPYPPETDPDPARPVAALGDGAVLTWKHAPTTDLGQVNLRSVFNADHASAYALTYVYSPNERKVTFMAGGDDVVRLWLNGQIVYELPGYKGWPFGLDRVEVTLRPGRNTLLAKVGNVNGAHHLMLRITDGPLDRGIRAAELGQWSDAAAELAKFADRTTALEDNDWHLWYISSHLLNLSDKSEEANQLCSRLLDKYGKTTDANLAWHLVRSLNFVPTAKVDRSRVVALAELALTVNTKEKWRQMELALAHYRAGQFERAVRQMTESGEDQHNAKAWAALGSIHHRLGHAEEARKWLERADEWYKRESKIAVAQDTLKLRPDWETWCDFLCLYREAIGLIRGANTGRDAIAAALAARGRLQLLQERGEHAAAAALAKELLAKHGDEPLVLLVAAKYHRAEADRLLAEAAGKPSPAAEQLETQAKAFFEKLLSLQPEDPLYQEEYAAQLRSTAKAPSALQAEWKTLELLDLKSSNGSTLTRQADGSVLVGGASPSEDKYTLTAKAPLKGITAFRLEVLPDPSLPNQGPGRSPGNGNFVLSEFTVEAGGKLLPLSVATASHSQITEGSWPILAALDGNPTTGWAIRPKTGQAHQAVFVLKTPLARTEETSLTFQLMFPLSVVQHTLGRFRLSATNKPLQAETVFVEEMSRTATNGWTRLAAARVLHKEWQAALNALEKARKVPTGSTSQEWFLQALVEKQLGQADRATQSLEKAYLGLSSNPADTVARPLIRDALAAGLQRAPEELSALARYARLQRSFGQRDAALAAYRKLAELEPKNPEWPMRLAQLRPEVNAFWNFDAGAEGWQPIGCNLIPADGYLKFESTSVDPNMNVTLKAPAGWKKVTLRTRCPNALNAQLFWHTSAKPEFTELISRHFVIPAGSEKWTDTAVYFKADTALTGLRFDPDNFTDLRLDVHSITLSELQSKEDLTAAIELLTREITSGPNSADLRRQRGSLYAQLGQAAEATTDFLKAIDLLAGEDQGTWYQERSSVYCEVAQWDDLFARIVKERPRDFSLWTARVLRFTDRRQWRQAAEITTRLIELNPSDAWNWFCDAALRLKLGDLEGYRRDCREMLNRFADTSSATPSDLTAKTCLLVPGSLSDLKTVSKLAEHAITGTEKDGSYRWFLMCRALADYREGQYAQAIGRAKKVAPSTTGSDLDATVFAVLALAHHQRAESTEARAALEKSRVLLEKGLLHLQGDDRLDNHWHDWLRCEVLFREAEKALNAPHRREAEAAVQAGRWAEALRHLDALVQANPTFWPDRVLRDRCYAHLGQWAEWEKLAAEYGKQFDANPPDEPDIWLEQAYLRVRRGDLADYRRLCSRMIERFGSNNEAHLKLAWTCVLGPNSLSDMASLLRLAVPLGNIPRAPYCTHALAATYYRLGQFGPTMEYLHRALEADPNWPNHSLIWVTLALAQHRQGQTDEACRCWEKTVEGLFQATQGRPIESAGTPWAFRDWLTFKALFHEAQPVFAAKPYAGDPRLAGSRARFLAMDRHWKEAVAEFDQAFKSRAPDERLHADRAAALMQLEQWKPALADWEQTRKLDPKNLGYLEQQARCYAHLGQWDKAAENWTTYQKLVENPAWALRERAVCFDHLGQWDKALADHNEAIRRVPEHDLSSFYVTRGEHWIWRGRWKEGAADFARAMDQPSPDWGFWTWKDMVLGLYMAGDTERARKALTRTLAFYDKPPADPIEAAWRDYAAVVAPGAVTKDNQDKLQQYAKLAYEFERPRLAAAILFRSGQVKEAAEQFSQHPGGVQYLYLASLAELQLGNRERAQKLVAEADAWMKETQAKKPGRTFPFDYWQDWVFYLVLQREAKTALKDSRAAEN
jgi:serine/threonine-protein kinase